MESLYAPWRSDYIQSFSGDSKRKEEKEGAECVLCSLFLEETAASLLLQQDPHCYVVMNKYPYAPGYLMVIPKRHISKLYQLLPNELTSLFRYINKASEVLETAINCTALNIGANIGQDAGAGIADHLHFHIVPCWRGDVNFITAIGETRVIPEDLRVTRGKILSAWGTPLSEDWG